MDQGTAHRIVAAGIGLVLGLLIAIGIIISIAPEAYWLLAAAPIGGAAVGLIVGRAAIAPLKWLAELFNLIN